MFLPVGQFQFRVLNKIGEGGLGTVDAVEVVQTNCGHVLGTRLARKRLNALWHDEPSARARFEREILTVARMTHPAIVAFEGENVAGADERCYFMPLYPRSLRDVLTNRSIGFSCSTVAEFGLQMAEAMEYAHTQGFVHRDLKPENILIDSIGAPVIADWGLGYFIHQYSKVLTRLTKAGLGTEYYCSIEQWNNGKCGPAGDIYSLGLVLAELLRGQPYPIQRVGLGIRSDVVDPVSHAAVAMNTLLQQMTHLLPGKRLQSMSAVASRLRTISLLAQLRPASSTG